MEANKIEVRPAGKNKKKTAILKVMDEKMAMNKVIPIIRDSYAQYETFEVELEVTDEIALETLQFIFALYKDCADHNKKLFMIHTTPEEVLTIIGNAGFREIIHN